MIYILTVLVALFLLLLITGIVSKKKDRLYILKKLKKKKYHNEEYLQFIEKIKKVGFTYRILDVKGKGFKVQILKGEDYEDLTIPYFNSYSWADRHYVIKRYNLYSESEHSLMLYLKAFKKIISNEFPIVRVDRHIMCPYVYVWKCNGSGQTSWDVAYVDPNSHYSRGEGYHTSQGYDVASTKIRAEEHLEYYLKKEVEEEAEKNRPKEIIINN